MNEWPKVAVGAIVIEDGKILLAKRRFKPSSNKWAIPGGHVEMGESLKEAVTRELYEETGLKAIKCEPYSITEYIEHGVRNQLLYHYLIIDFLVKVEPGKPRLNEESLDIGYFDLKEALNLELTISTRKVIHSLLTPNYKKFQVVHQVTKLKQDEYDRLSKELIELEKQIGLR